jgi:REP-associated tyrosine transposase
MSSRVDVRGFKAGSRERQLTVPKTGGWGGARKGAGRKPKGRSPEVAHASRAPLAARYPVHVTSRIVRGVPYLRRGDAYAIVRGAMRDARDRLGMRIVHYSVQSDHLHLLVEAIDQVALGRAMKGLGVRIARRLNRAVGRTGRLIADRYHARYLRSPVQVRRALVDVLQNRRKHVRAAEARVLRGLDPFSSAPYFPGWDPRWACGRCPALPTDDPRAAVVAPRTWLLRVGWLRGGGPLRPTEAPT